MQNKWLVLASMYLDSGTEYIAGVRVVHPSYVYTGSVLAWGSIDRSIPIPAGLPQTSDAKIRVADTNRHWRDLLYNQTPRRRYIDLRLVEAGTSESAAALLFTGEIVDAFFGPGYVEFTLRDRTWAWLDEPIPAMLIRDIYPDIPPENEGGFLNIIFGEMRSTGPNASPPVDPVGVIPCPHYGLVGSPPTVDRYGVAANRVAAVLAVYRRNGNVWDLVDPSEYTITETFVTAFNVDMIHTFIDFTIQSPPIENAEIRADVDGIDGFGAWGTLPTVNPSSPPTARRNPIEFFIDMTFFITRKAGVSEDVFDTDDICALWQVFEDGFGSPPLIYYCDGAVTKPITAREWLGQFLASFNLQMYQKTNGKITLRFIQDEDPSRPVFSEGKYILRESFAEALPENFANQFIYRYEYNPARGDFETNGVYDTAEQTVLELDGVPKVELDRFDFYFVRDAATALDVVTKRAEFMALGSYRQYFDLPMPPTHLDVELGKQVGLTHSQGLALGGYVNHEVVLTRLRYELDNQRIACESILRVPRDIGIPVLGIRQSDFYDANQDIGAPDLGLILANDVRPGNALIAYFSAHENLGGPATPSILADTQALTWDALLGPTNLRRNIFLATATDDDQLDPLGMLLRSGLNSQNRHCGLLEIDGTEDGYTISERTGSSPTTISVTTGTDAGERLLVFIIIEPPAVANFDFTKPLENGWERPPAHSGTGFSGVYIKTVATGGTLTEEIGSAGDGQLWLLIAYKPRTVRQRTLFTSERVYLPLALNDRSLQMSIASSTLGVPNTGPWAIDDLNTTLWHSSTAGLPQWIGLRKNMTRLSRVGWIATATTSLDSTRTPVHALDNNLGTEWHSVGVGAANATIFVDMGGVKTIDCVELIPRQSFLNEHPTRCKVYTSDDGVSYTERADISGITVDFNTSILLPMGASYDTRYFSVAVITSNTGNAAIAEIYAGLQETAEFTFNAVHYVPRIDAGLSGSFRAFPVDITIDVSTDDGANWTTVATLTGISINDLIAGFVAVLAAAETADQVRVNVTAGTDTYAAASEIYSGTDDQLPGGGVRSDTIAMGTGTLNNGFGIVYRYYVPKGYQYGFAYWNTGGLPQTMTIDLGSVREFDMLRVMPRQDSSDDRMPTQIDVEVSADGITYSSLGSFFFTFSYPTLIAQRVQLLDMKFAAVQAARYVNLTFISTNSATEPVIAQFYVGSRSLA